jgi:glycosyltransferase involved in cell wall biosynthesis
MTLTLQSDTRPRVLHLIKWLPRGGIETWLTHILSHSAGGSVRHELLLMQDEIGPYEAKVRAAGIPIHILPIRSWPQWFTALPGLLRSIGPIDIIHAHSDSVISGPALALAKLAGVPVRIIHNHAARSMGADYQALKYRLREGIGNWIARQAATRRIGISDMALIHLAGPDWRKRKDCTLLLYGFDYSAFHDAARRAAQLRQVLAIPPSARVIGHVGRFDPVKNHPFLIRTFAEYLDRDPNAVLVMVGVGRLQGEIEALVEELGIAGQVCFAGGTDDIAAYMRLFDIFVFPSFSEGLGIVVLEAQAAGCPVLMPDNMPREVIVIEEAIALLPLDAGEAAWAGKIEHILAPGRAPAEQWLARVEASSFGLTRCVEDLHAIYRDELDQRK